MRLDDRVPGQRFLLRHPSSVPRSIDPFTVPRGAAQPPNSSAGCVIRHHASGPSIFLESTSGTVTSSFSPVKGALPTFVLRAASPTGSALEVALIAVSDQLIIPAP